MLILILIPASTDIIYKKRDSKLDIFIAGNSGFIKIVFALLTKPIAIQFQFLKYKPLNRRLKDRFLGSTI